MSRWLGPPLGLWLLACALGCKGSVDAQPPVATGATSSSVAATASAALALGPRWGRAARSMDPTDLADVARDLGGTKLLALVDRPDARAVALAALPYAADAELAFAGLIARARSSPGSEGAAYLDAIAACLEVTSHRGEWLAAEPIALAMPALGEIARDPRRDEAERALAATVIHRLRERGFRGAEEPAFE